MILIVVDSDLRRAARDLPLAEISMWMLKNEGVIAADHAEDVYFWRDGEVKALKRRNASLVVPDWLEGREGVDR